MGAICSEDRIVLTDPIVALSTQDDNGCPLTEPGERYTAARQDRIKPDGKTQLVGCACPRLKVGGSLKPVYFERYTRKFRRRRGV